MYSTKICLNSYEADFEFSTNADALEGEEDLSSPDGYHPECLDSTTETQNPSADGQFQHHPNGGAVGTPEINSPMEVEEAPLGDAHLNFVVDPINALAIILKSEEGINDTKILTYGYLYTLLGCIPHDLIDLDQLGRDRQSAWISYLLDPEKSTGRKWWDEIDTLYDLILNTKEIKIFVKKMTITDAVKCHRRQHNRKSSATKAKASQETTATRQKSYKCGQGNCEYATPNETLLGYHLRRVHNRHIWLCALEGCNKSLVKKCAVYNHLRHYQKHADFRKAMVQAKLLYLWAHTQNPFQRLLLEDLFDLSQKKYGVPGSNDFQKVIQSIYRDGTSISTEIENILNKILLPHDHFKNQQNSKK